MTSTYNKGNTHDKLCEFIVPDTRDLGNKWQMGKLAENIIRILTTIEGTVRISNAEK